jgi:hypothetical protein
MALKLIETLVSETAVRMRYADDADAPNEWLDFQVSNQALKMPSGTVMTERDIHALGAVKLAALRHVLAATETEIGRIRDLISRIP